MSAIPYLWVTLSPWEVEQHDVANAWQVDATRGAVAGHKNERLVAKARRLHEGLVRDKGKL